MGAVGYIKSKLSLLYAMAISIISRMILPRVGARVFGQLALAGFEIS